ncbi:MAG: sulfurtransferase [Pseudomonadota bacterium]
MSDTLVDVEWLAEHRERCVILDCRATLGQIGQGRQEYLLNHIEGAIFADLDADLADPPDHRGRHPLPSLARWQATLQSWGITNQSQVVTYDDAGGAFAARAWWMIKWAGHANVAVLDGGWGAWCANNFATTAQVHEPSPSSFTLHAPLVELVQVDQVHKSLTEEDFMLIDARAYPRFAGKEEPIDPVAGHIPGALCKVFQDNLDEHGRFKSAEELRLRFAAQLASDKPVVCYCGSGVTAAHNVLAMQIAGLNAGMYADSWSGWITNPNRPVAID